MAFCQMINSLSDEGITQPVGSEGNKDNHERAAAISRCANEILPGHVLLLSLVLNGSNDFAELEAHHGVVLVPVGVVLGEGSERLL